MILQALLLQTILKVAPPGYSKFSVTKIECRGEACSDYKWSTFYNSYVEKESKEDGKARYAIITGEVVTLAKNKLCLDDNLKTVSNCKRSSLFREFKFVELVSIEAAAMIAESGIREDVEVGRGHAGHTKPADPLTDDAGGEGIGPGGEVCLVQVHPLVLAAFHIDPQTFLGSNSEALENCLGFGMDMFARSRNVCAYQASKTPELEHDWVFETFSVYGTGSTCASANNGKTAYRKSLYTAISSDFGARIRKEQRREAKAAQSPTLPVPPPSKI